MKDNRKKEKRRLLFWFVFLLVVSVVSTSILTIKVMDKFYYNSADAIEISPQNPNAFQQDTPADPQPGPDTPSGQGSSPSASTTGHMVDTQVSVPTNPGFETSDENGSWSTNTAINIFKSGYGGAQASDGGKIIAPGTQNSYVFKLANTGDVGLDFTLDIDAYVTPAGVQLPVQTRLQRYDGQWIAGDEAIWVDTPALDTATDEGQLGVGRYIYYTLDWQWPYETGLEADDVADTALGNWAAAEDLTLTIVIKTTATGDSETLAGIRIPDTGDNTGALVWGSVAVCSAVALVATLFFRFIIRDKEEEDSAGGTDIEKE